jgi:superoxide dismutase
VGKQLLRAGSVVLHEHYFANLGGDGRAGDEMLAAIKQQVNRRFTSAQKAVATLR